MAIHYRTQGFILQKTDRGEADRIFTIYTKDFGKLEILVKAERKIKSKLKGGLGLFCLSEIEFIQGKTHKTLTDAILTKNFPNLRKSLERLPIAYKISEILDNLIKGQESDEQIWNLLKETCQRLDNQQLTINNQQLLYQYFLWNLFSILGYQPELYNCSICQKKLTPEKLYFDPKQGGIVCDNCFKQLETHLPRIDSDTVKILRLFSQKNWGILKRLKLKGAYFEALESISENYLNYILEEIK